MSKLESAKKVTTYNPEGQENGWLLELAKEGRCTTSYMTCIGPGGFKGYHLHKVRAANYVCVKGSAEIELWSQKGLEKVTLDASEPQRLHIPIRVATGLRNLSDTEECWIVNVPEPAYDPDLVGEQVEYSLEQLESLLK